jgi:hypothetical protein
LQVVTRRDRALGVSIVKYSHRVSNTVAIVSVAATGAVGLGGLAATTWGTTSERRWKSREERAVDARKVLAEGAEALTDLTWKLQTIRKKQLAGTVTDADLKDVEDILGPRSLAVTAQIALRYGVDTPETDTFAAWSTALRDVLPALQAGGPKGEQYTAAWNLVMSAEKAYFEMTAELLA